MNAIIAGAGEVGGHAAEVLSSVGHNVTLIDLSAEKLEVLNDRLDIRTLVGNCGHLDVLQEAGAAKCDLMVAATSVDEINLLAGSLAKAAGARRTIVRVHHTANFSLRGTAFQHTLGIDELICPEYLTSLSIARTIRNPGVIAMEDFARGQLVMERFQVTGGAAAIGKRLADLSMPPGTRVVTVERNGGGAIADASTAVQEGDYVTLLGESSKFDAARKQFQTGKDRRIHIAIMGGTSTVVWVCRALTDRRFSVRVFVENRARAEELAHKLPHVTVHEADPTDILTFAEEHLEQADSFIAATSEDERNILACAQAKTQGVDRTIAVVQHPKYVRLVSHVGIDHAFSPRADAVKSILALIDTDPVRTIATFARGTAEVYQIRPSSRAKVLGHELRNIRLPAQTMIAAVRRDERVYVPGADDQIQAGDALLVIGPIGLDEDLRKLFVTK
jgi:trk system potassium uptake protein TrkA